MSWKGLFLLMYPAYRHQPKRAALQHQQLSCPTTQSDDGAGHLGDVIDIKKDKTKLHVHTEIPVSKRCGALSWVFSLEDRVRCLEHESLQVLLPLRHSLPLDITCDCSGMQISQVLDQEVPEEAQCARLAPSDCFKQGSQVSDTPHFLNRFIHCLSLPCAHVWLGF